MKRLYLDADSVLLRNTDSTTVLAPHAETFIDFALRHFQCFWLNYYCSGDTKPVLIRLAPYVDDLMLAKLRAVQPTRFDQLRTEALAGDFYWLESSPSAAEVTDLCRRHALSRWLQVNPGINPNALMDAICELRVALVRPPSNVTHRRPAEETARLAMYAIAN